MSAILLGPRPKKISVILFGRSGVGKSRIGNFLLTGSPNGPFKAGHGGNSCTQHPMIQSKYDRELGRHISCTDTPGIPDTNPAKTRDHYNACVDMARKGHSSMLFVFKFGRIDPPAYEQAEILFREINKASCMKILVINDHTDHDAFGDPWPSAEDYSVVEEEIRKYTKINFDTSIYMNSKNMRVSLETMKDALFEGRAAPVPSPGLRNFDELGRWVDELRQKKNTREAITKEKKDELDLLLKRYTRLELLTGAATAGAISGAMAAFFTLGLSVGITAASIGAAAALVPAMEALKLDIKKRKQEIGKGDLDEAAKELESSAERFFELKEAVEGREASSPPQPADGIQQVSSTCCAIL